jgi:hypothetical protein
MPLSFELQPYHPSNKLSRKEIAFPQELGCLETETCRFRGQKGRFAGLMHLVFMTLVPGPVPFPSPAETQPHGARLADVLAAERAVLRFCAGCIARFCSAKVMP